MLIPTPLLFTAQIGRTPSPVVPPHQRILDLASSDGWQSIYDFNNPETQTLRDGGSGQFFYSEVADGLGARNPLIQTTGSNQPIQVEYNGYKMGEFGSSRLMSRTVGDITTPRVFSMIVRATSSANFRNFIGDNANNFFAQTGNYAFLISDASSNLNTADYVFASGELVIVTGIWDSGANNAKIRVNGVEVFQGTLSPPTMNGLRVGYSFPGQIGLVAIYQGSLAGEALQRMENLLRDIVGA